MRLQSMAMPIILLLLALVPSCQKAAPPTIAPADQISADPMAGARGADLQRNTEVQLV